MEKIILFFQILSTVFFAPVFLLAAGFWQMYFNSGRYLFRAILYTLAFIVLYSITFHAAIQSNQ
jgi:hypothetical protein